MGINCAAVMKVINWVPPPDIESYVQETGRGGRDGSPCSAVLFLKHSHLKTCMCCDICDVLCKLFVSIIMLVHKVCHTVKYRFPF